MSYCPAILTTTLAFLVPLGACSPVAQRSERQGEALFSSPQGIAAHARYILVANSAFHYDEAGAVAYGQGFVSLIERASARIVAQIPTSAPNPGNIAIHGDLAYIVNSGVVQVRPGEHAKVREAGSLDIIDLSGSEPPGQLAATLALGRNTTDDRIGAYGSIAISDDGKVALIGSGTRADVFVVDLERRQVVRGPSDPVVVVPTPRGDNGLTVVRWLQGGFAVLDFNSDQLCRPSSGHYEAFRCESVGREPELLEGPIDLVEGAEGELWVLMTVANGLYRYEPSAGASVGSPPVAVGTGLSANRVLAAGGKLYVINSLSHTLQRITLPGGATERSFVAFPVGSNPYDGVVTEEEGMAVAWITLFGSHQVARVNLASGEQTLVGGAPAQAEGGPPARDAGVGADCGEREPVVGIGGVVALRLGPGGGHNTDALPEVIMGGPQGAGSGSGASEGVLSLGAGGELVVHFGDYELVDGPGADFIVFENPFLQGPYQSYAEPAWVGLSVDDPEIFTEFQCDLTMHQGSAQQAHWAYPGCAGVRPVLAGQLGTCIDSRDGAAAGGDPFDLAELGLSSARYLRLRDAGLSALGTTTRGFDLDAVVLINYRRWR